MYKEVAPYIGIPYRFSSVPLPDKIGLPPDKIDSLNCQRLIHELYRYRFGITLPSGLWSKELFEDTNLFRVLTEYDHPLEGDIYFFSRREDTDPKWMHIAYCIGSDDDGTAMLTHATCITGDVTTWKLPKFHQYKRYAHMRGVKRLRDE